MFDLEARRYSVLVVEDEELTRSNYAGIIDQEFEVLMTSTGESGLEIMSRKEIHIVVSDFHLPGMDGVKFLYRVSNMFPEAVPMLLSGDKELLANLDKEGNTLFFRCLTKPLSGESLLENLHQAAEYFELTNRIKDLEMRLNAREKEVETIQRRVIGLEYVNLQFRSMLSHKMANAINSIQFATSLLSDYSSETTEEQREELLKIMRSSSAYLTASARNIGEYGGRNDHYVEIPT